MGPTLWGKNTLPPGLKLLKFTLGIIPIFIIKIVVVVGLTIFNLKLTDYGCLNKVRLLGMIIAYNSTRGGEQKNAYL